VIKADQHRKEKTRIQIRSENKARKEKWQAMKADQYRKEKTRVQIRSENKARMQKWREENRWKFYPVWLLPRELADVIKKFECDE
jgi:hypothetical protein